MAAGIDVLSPYDSSSSRIGEPCEPVLLNSTDAKTQEIATDFFTSQKTSNPNLAWLFVQLTLKTQAETDRKTNKLLQETEQGYQSQKTIINLKKELVNFAGKSQDTSNKIKGLIQELEKQGISFPSEKLQIEELDSKIEELRLMFKNKYQNIEEERQGLYMILKIAYEILKKMEELIKAINARITR